MADVLQVAEKLSKMNRTAIEKVLIRVLDMPSTQKFLIDLNTRVQLFQEGENSLGVKLSDIGGDYTASTKLYKSKKGQPTNRVTLYDTGDFYGSFTVEPTASADFIIDSDPMKGSFDLFERWGEDVEGLNEENLQMVLDYLEAKFWAVIFRGL
jgi:hypothetical protein